jgi:putative lipase involved disintegration of autophagic bodies
MLDGLLEAIQNLSDFSFAETVDEIVKVNAEEFLDIVRKQLEYGYDGTGNRIYIIDKQGEKKYEYAQYTIDIKRDYGVGIGAVTDHITLYDTGEFHSSLYIALEASGDFEILSSDPKYPLLALLSGEHLLEISQTNSAVLLEEKFFPELQFALDKLFE